MPPVRGQRGDPRVFIAIDVGTTGARALAVDLGGRVLREVRKPYPTYTPRPGWVEQDASSWGDAALAALATLSRRLGNRRQVVALGLTGQCPSVVPVDDRGEPLGPGLIYRDNRATAEAEQMTDTIGREAVHQLTGHVPEPFHVGPKILWLRRHDPERFAATRWFLQPRDLVLHHLTGTVATDQSHANATLFFDLRKRRWSEELLGKFDLSPRLFPKALPPWALAGSLRGDLASDLSLPELPVVIGAADSQCAAFGAGVWEAGPVSEMAGSSSCLNSSVVEPLADPAVTHYSHAVRDRYSTELGVNTSGAALTWALQRLGFRDYKELERRAAIWYRRMRRIGGGFDPREAAPLFLPFLGDGERDDPALRAAFVGLSERHGRDAIAYAVVEGVALAVARVIQRLRRAGSPVEDLRVAGGGARLAVLGQLKAEALGVPVLHLDVDTAGVGAALMAAQQSVPPEEVAGAVRQILERAERFEPDPKGAIFATRSRWFDAVVESSGIRL